MSSTVCGSCLYSHVLSYQSGSLKAEAFTLCLPFHLTERSWPGSAGGGGERPAEEVPRHRRHLTGAGVTTSWLQSQQHRRGKTCALFMTLEFTWKRDTDSFPLYRKLSPMPGTTAPPSGRPLLHQLRSKSRRPPRPLLPPNPLHRPRSSLWSTPTAYLLTLR